MSDRTKQLFDALCACIDELELHEKHAHDTNDRDLISRLEDARTARDEWDEHISNPARPLLIELAQEHYANEDEMQIQIDDDAELSEADEGTWVAAWVWLPSQDSDDEERDDA